MTRRPLYLEAAALVLFLAGFLGSDPYSQKTASFVWMVSGLGAGSLASLALIRQGLLRNWRGAVWALRARGLVALQITAGVAIGAIIILALTAMSLGHRESLGLPAAVFYVWAEVSVVISAIRSFKKP